MSENIDPAKLYLDRMQRALEILDKKAHQQQVDDLEALINRIRPAYPKEAVDIFDAMRAVCSYCIILSQETLDTIFGIWQDAWGWSGESYWSFKRGVLRLEYYPKKTGERYVVEFRGRDNKKAPLSELYFPLSVELETWADMDIPDNHSDFCSSIYPDEHKDGCAVVPLKCRELDGEKVTEEEWDEAYEDCECTDECLCEPFVTGTESKIFEHSNTFRDDCTRWLQAKIWGGG